MDTPLTLILDDDTEVEITRLDAGHYVLADGRTIPALDAPSDEDAEAALQQWLAGTHPVQLAERRSELRARAAQRRYAVECGGITLGGVPVATDRDSRSMLDGALSLLDLDPDWSTHWKGPDGVFRPVGGVQIRAIAQAVGDHVSACFTHEAYLLDEIEQATTSAELDAVAAEIELFIL